MPARTIAGVLCKTVLLAEFYPGGSDFECATQGLERRLANDPIDDAVAFGIARDLLALAREGVDG